MTSERWQQVNDLFQSVAERAPEERTTYLEAACQGDEALRREVESLIASYERAETFIETPVFEVVPELLTNDRLDAIVGESIGHYRIESLIGVGGMGHVYLARDERLGRKVALKFLPERLTADHMQLSRFKSEARSASALNHPNILTVYEIGSEGNRHFIATEFIEGVTLRAALAHGRLSVPETLEIAVQVASALAAAHEAGVIHRDIKPENIMLRPDGYVKVLDFGLAKLTEQQPASDNQDITVTNAQLTHAGLVLGTPRYMSPEQTRGQRVNAGTDIWSLGVVIYEMLGGVSPFTGKTPSDCIASILKTEPPPLSTRLPDVPIGLESIVQKALRKNWDERYQKIAEMLADLRAVGARLESQAAAPKIKRDWLWAAGIAAIAIVSLAISIFIRYHNWLPTDTSASVSTSSLASAPIPNKSVAVMPFENLSRDPDNAYFAEGIQDEILTRLSKIADLKVISRTSTQHYQSAPNNLPEIATQLGVAHILEGSVQKSGDTVRVNVQLIKAATDSHVWADTFDRKLTDIFSVESEVAKAIAEQLQAKLTGQEEQVIAAKPTDNPEAYDAYLRGLAYSLKTANSTANVLNAQKYLREAVRLDPNFALSWALLSFVEARGYGTVTLQPTDALREEARQAADTALSLQPNLGEAVLAKGFYHYACLKDYDTAVRYFEQARPLLPNSSRIPESLAYVTRRQGQWDWSEKYFKEAERLDPRNVSLLTQHALSYKDRRQFPEALRKLEEILNIAPDDIDTIVEKGAIAQAQGDLPRASALLASVQPAADDTNALETQAYQAILERRSAPIISQLKVLLANPDVALGFYKGGLRFWLGWAQDVTGDHVAARESWQQARRELEPFLSEQPENHILLGDLALTAMSLGDKAAALDFSERAMTALPVEKDAVRGPATIEFLARVAANVGEPDRAVAALQKLLSIPYSGALGPGAPLTPALLRLDPMFDPLRNDSRFQKLIGSADFSKEFRTPAAITEKSIAVLPFENRSRDPDNAFFTDGVQDEILTDLARIADLKVISRTSVMQYKTGAKRNLRQIGTELGVAHVLEGSVQRAGNRVRVNAQLIDARTDAHLWAQTYDRDLADVFAIQSEIAKTIADQLQAKLSSSEKSAIEQAPTTDITAFNLYSHAKNLFLTAFAGANGRADLLQAADLLKQAVTRDPLFFQAYCQLAFTEINIYGVLDHTPEYLAHAEAALQSAIRLRPDAGETHLARARNLYWGYLDYDGALRELEIARQSLPGEDWIFSLKGYIARRQGRWEECLWNLERATELDPRNVLTLQQLAMTYEQLRHYAKQKSTYERILAFEPNDPIIKSLHALVEIDSKAHTQPLHEVIDSIREKNSAALSSIADNWLLCAFAERDPAAASEALMALGQNPASLGPIVDVRFNRPFIKGIIARMAKDGAEVRSAFIAARAEQQKIVEAQPNHAPALCALGLIDAGLGRKEDALREGRRAVELCPIEKDAMQSIAMAKYFAMIAAWVGEKDLACEQLAICIRSPGDLSYGQLKLMPFWDPLRGDPRFEKIVASLAPKE